MRTHIKRRIIALWLSVCMALTMMPSMALPVWAALDATLAPDEISIGEDTVELTKPQDALISGHQVYEGKLDKVLETTAAQSTEIKLTPKKKAKITYKVIDSVSEDIADGTDFGSSTEGIDTEAKQTISELSAAKKIIYIKLEEVDGNSAIEYIKLTLNIKDKPDSITPKVEAFKPGQQSKGTLKVETDNSGVTQYKYKIVESQMENAAFYKEDRFDGSGYTDGTKEALTAGVEISVENNKYIEVYGLDANNLVKSWGVAGPAKDNYVEKPAFEEYSVYAETNENKQFKLQIKNEAPADNYEVYEQETGGDKVSGASASKSGSELTVTLSNAFDSYPKDVYIAAKDGSENESARTKVTLNEYQYKTDADIVEIKETTEAPLFEAIKPEAGSGDLQSPTQVDIELSYKSGGSKPNITLTLPEGAQAYYIEKDSVGAPLEINKEAQAGAITLTGNVTHEKPATVFVKVFSDGQVVTKYYKLVITMASPKNIADIASLTVNDKEVAVKNVGTDWESIEKLECKVDYTTGTETATIKVVPEDAGATIKVSESASDASSVSEEYTAEAGKELSDVKFADGNTGKKLYIKVTAENGTDMRLVELTVKVEDPKSVAEISALTIDGFDGTPNKEAAGDGESTNPFEYTVAVPATTIENLGTGVPVSVTVADPTVSKVDYGITAGSYSKTDSLTNDGTDKTIWAKDSVAEIASKVIWFEVTAQDGTTKKYYKATLVETKIVVDDVKPEIDLGRYEAALGETLTDEGVKINDSLAENSNLEDLITDIAQDVVNKDNEEYEAAAKQALEDAKIEVEDNVYIHVIPSMKIDVKDYSSTPGYEKLLMDVTPIYVVKASTDKETATDENSVVIARGGEIEGAQNVKVKLPIDEAFAKDSTKLYVRLDSEAFVKEYEVTSNAIEILFPHFSEVEITKNHGEASVGESDSKLYYDTLQDAVDAILEGEDGEITLYSRPAAPATVKKAGKVTLKADAGYTEAGTDDLDYLKGILRAGNGLELQENDPTGDVGSSGLAFNFKVSEEQPTPPTPGTPDTPITTGDLTVSKTVTGDEGDKTKEFNFTVTLGDTAITGTYGSMTFANGVATFKLKDGQSVKATSLPKDITYTVAEAEANQDGYTTTSTGASGTITAGVNVTAAFTNTKGSGGDQPTPPPVGESTLRFASSTQEEALKDRATNDNDCALKLEAVDGADIGDLSSWKVKSDNPDVVQVLDNNELRYMDLGTANITVTATGKDGKTYTITFPVNVTKLGTPTFTLSHVSSKKARTFTVTTSTVRGATGFQVQYSLKKSLKSSKQPSYAVGKKLNRKTIKANKSKRTYYVRVRAYKIVDGERINGAWSKLTKKIKSK